MELRAARRAERPAVLDLLAHWYNDRQFFARYNLNDPAFRDSLCLVAVDDGRIASTVQIFDRAVHLGGHQVPMGGIGSVYTHRDYRRRGLASALMRLAVETMNRERFEVSILFAERVDFYARFGWESVERTFSLVGGGPQAPASGKLVTSQFDPATDLTEVAAIYRRYSGRFDSTTVRSDSYWHGNLAYAGNPNEYFVVARPASGAGIVAYARSIRFYGLPMVMEFGYRDGAIASLVELFAYLSGIAASQTSPPADHAKAHLLEPAAAKAPAAGMLTHTAHDPEFEAALKARGFTIAHHRDSYYMWRVVRPAEFANRLGIPESAASQQMLELAGAPRALFWTADRF